MKTSHYSKKSYLAIALFLILFISGEVKSQPDTTDASHVVVNDTMRAYIAQLLDSFNCDCNSQSLTPKCLELCLQFSQYSAGTDESQQSAESPTAAFRELMFTIMLMEKAYEIKDLFDYNESINTKGYDTLKFDYTKLNKAINNLDIRYKKALVRLIQSKDSYLNK